MKRAMSATSLDAFATFVMGDQLPRQQRQLVDFLAVHPGGFTRAELAERTGLRLSSVCGRCHELIASGVVEEASRRPCSVTGVSAHVLRLAPAQRSLFDEAA